MADKKISQLAAATVPLAGTEQLPIVQSGSTVRTTVDDILNAESITYAQAMSLISGGGVVRGKNYRLTDFQTKHYLVDGSGSQDTSVIFTGTLEPLILTGASSTAFSSVAISSNYPQDIIHIDLDPNNFLTDLSFTDVYGVSVIPGFKGVITYREDTKNNNKFNFDFRNCKFRRWKADPPTWSSLVTYSIGDTVQYSDVIYYAHSASTNVTPSTLGSVSWLPIVDCSSTFYVSSVPSDTDLQPDSLDFIDTTMFAQLGVTGTYETAVRNNVFAPGFDDNGDQFYYNGTRLPNSVIYLPDNTFFNIYENVFSTSFVGNTITGYAFYCSFVNFDENITTSINGSGDTWTANKIYFSNGGVNQINIMSFCRMGGGFADNVGTRLSGTNANFFNNNKFTSIESCNFKSVGQANTIANMNNCNFNAGANKNYFNEYISSLTTSSTLVFQRNIVETGISGNYSAATHVYGVYSCNIVTKPNGSAALFYIDNANALVVAAATA